jgi:nicotinamide riboside kinase
MSGVLCEQCQEYAKELAWDQDKRRLEEQLIVFSGQYERLARVAGQVDIVITDSPLLLSTIYCSDAYPDSFKILVRDMDIKFDSVNILIKRTVEFESEGRVHDHEKALILDMRIKKMLDAYGISYTEVDMTTFDISTLWDVINSRSA